MSRSDKLNTDYRQLPGETPEERLERLIKIYRKWMGEESLTSPYRTVWARQAARLAAELVDRKIRRVAYEIPGDPWPSAEISLLDGRFLRCFCHAGNDYEYTFWEKGKLVHEPFRVDSQAVFECRVIRQWLVIRQSDPNIYTFVIGGEPYGWIDNGAVNSLTSVALGARDAAHPEPFHVRDRRKILSWLRNPLDDVPIVGEGSQ